jgi:hypothetical protein
MADDSDFPPARSYPVCAQTAQILHARLGWTLACGLEKGHEGEHLPRSYCIRHGDYYGPQCPHWPMCMSGAEIRRRESLRHLLWWFRVAKKIRNLGRQGKL